MKQAIGIGYNVNEDMRRYFLEVARCADAHLHILSPSGPFTPRQDVVTKKRLLEILEESLPESKIVIVDGFSFGAPREPKSDDCLVYRTRMHPENIKKYDEAFRQRHGEERHDFGKPPVILDDLLSLVDEPFAPLQHEGLIELDVPKAVDEYKQRTGSITPILFRLQDPVYGLRLSQELMRIGYDWIIPFSGDFNSEEVEPQGIVNITENVIAVTESMRNERK